MAAKSKAGGMRMSTKKMAIMGVLCAISILLVYLVHFPVFPAAPFLEYDPADIPIMLGTFLFGPAAGLTLTAIVSILQGLTVSAHSGVIGILMHIFATGSFVLMAGFVYRKAGGSKRVARIPGELLSLLAGVLTMTVTMVLWNLLLTPLFMGSAIESVLPLLLSVIVPFNLLKAGINACLAYILFKAVAKPLRSLE